MKEFQLSVLPHGIWASDRARVENTSTFVSIRSRNWANYPDGSNGNKNEKSEDYSKADLKQRVLFFITIFRLAIPAFFRFTDVT